MKSIIITCLFVSLMGIQQLSAETNVSSKDHADSLLLERAIRGYDLSMQHEFDSVVESSIYNAMMLAVEEPQSNLSIIEHRLKELSKAHPTRSIRIKAFIALEFMHDQDFRQNFTNALVAQPQQGDKATIFRSLSEQLITKAGNTQ